MLGEIGEIPVLFKSMIPSEISFTLDFSSAGSFSIITTLLFITLLFITSQFMLGTLRNIFENDLKITWLLLLTNSAA